MINFALFLCFLFLSLACESNQFEALVTRHYSSFAEDESFKLYKGTSATGNPILSVNGTSSQSNTEQSYDICVEQGDYFLEFTDTRGDGWGTDNAPSYVLVEVEGIRFYRGGLPYQPGTALKQGTDSFKVSFITTSTTEWKYTDDPQYEKDWTQHDFYDEDWSTATPGNFPAFTAITRYYRTRVNITDRDHISALYSSIFNTYGFVYYLQGIDISRYHMTFGNIYPKQRATSSDGSYNVVTSASKFKLPTSGSFLIAYEVHLTSDVSEVPDNFVSHTSFGIRSNVGDTGSNIFIHGKPSAKPEGVSSEFDSSKIFDERKDTYYYCQDCYEPEITFTFSNGRAEWINSYMIRSASTDTCGFPTGWTLYGKNYYDSSWTVLHKKTNVVFPTVMYPLYFQFKTNTISYNSYKLRFESNSNRKFALGQFEVYTANHDKEVTGLEYEPSYINGIVFSVNIDTRPIIDSYRSFSVTPELPAGVKLDTNTGVISGIPLVVVNATYTITATRYKTQLEESTTIILDIEPCSYPTHIAVLFEKINSYSYDDLYTVIDSAGQTYNSPPFSYQDPDLIYYCLPAGTIDVHLGHEKKYSWDRRARLNIKLSDGEGGYYTISSISRNVQCVNDFSYDISFKIYPHSSSWTYTTSLVPNWYGTDSVSGFSPYDPSNPPSSNGQYVWFFRTSVNMNSTSYVGFELRVKARAGLVVYVNGIEFLRKNLPEGEITTTTGATLGDIITKYHVVTGPNSVFNEGSNVIAIGIVNLADSNPNEIIFDATLQQLKPNDAGRSIDLTITTLPTTSFPEDLYDFSYSSYWHTYITDRSPNQYFIIDYQYDSHRSEYFNEYCITSADDSRSYDPSDWTVYGSKDGTNFEVLSSSVNFRFPERRFTKCFYMLNHKEAYSLYKLNVTKVAVPAEHRSDLYIAELVFSLTDVSHIIVPDFSYDKTSYTGYVGAPFPTMTSSSIYFTGYTISPKLPSSLELDTFSGSIVGTPQHILSSSTYTISAKNIYDEIVSVQVTLSVEECELPNNLFTILIQSSDAGEEMGFTLKNSTGTTVFTQSGFSNKQANYYPQCRPTDTYTLTLTGQNQNSWTKGSFKVLLADDNSLLFGTIDNNELSKDFKFYIGYLVAPMISSYMYLNNNSAPPDDWNQLQISSTDSWKEARPGEFGDFVNITAYFRKTFTITSLDNMVSLSFSFRTNYGLIAYINGQNVYSFNMPKGPISYRTKCNSRLYNMANVGSTFSIQTNNLVVGTNVLSIEVHRYSRTEQSPITIDSLLYLVVDNSYRVIDGKADSETGKIGSELLFDNMRNTVHVSGYHCTKAVPQWVYNNDRREVISSYTVINGPTCNVRTPSGWRIEGSNDGKDWSVLHEIDRQIFTKYGEEKIYNFYNTRGFNRYRMVVTECINQEISESSLDCGFGSNISLQLAEWGLYAKNQVASCKPTEDGFDGALEGQYTYKDCELYYEGVYKAKCVGGELVDITNECTPKAVARVSYGDSIADAYQYRFFNLTPVVEGVEYTCSISPSLPNGVNFDPSTGTISGTFTTVDRYYYRVKCSNIAGSVSTSISIDVIKKDKEEEEEEEETKLSSLAWVLLTVAIVVSLVFLTLCVINRVKMQKRHQNRLVDKYSSMLRAESSRREYDDLKRSIFV